MTAPPPPAALMRDLATVLHEAQFTADGVAAHLGPDATDALYRGEPGVVLAATRGGTQLDGLIRFFLLRRPVSGEELADLIGSRLALSLVDASFATQTPAGDLVVNFDVRPHIVAGEPRLVVSDRDASVTELVPGRDHVLGVGAASLSLLSAAPQVPVGRVLDLGTGSGIQALAQAAAAEQVVATDVHPRALELASATLAANGVENVELREGAWFEPVIGERFDRIVANPPFVVGLPEVGHVYRDSGLGLDGATELVVSQAANHLAEDGTACILGAWVHTLDTPWQNRVASWLPSSGVSAWVLQRDVVDPGMYVSTWLKDESVDLRSREAFERSEAWLDYFDDNDVHAIGFGWVFLRDIGDAPSEITAEEVRQPFNDPLGPEVEEYFSRTAWLRAADKDAVLDATYVLRPGVALEEVQLADQELGMGFTTEVIRITRTDGPRFTHDVDEALRAVLAGLHPQGLPLREVVGLLAASRGMADAEALGELEDQAAAAIVDLVRHGIVIPSAIAEVVR
ncbi:class I SAM-dependent methyltransferase [Corynebacterium sp. TA-R-1]|uniref:Class I SAM-dependent methyltransferase n=1 Tax=Corynebacterium stercoris TaxID=2943490 RepID=A0ABT1G2E5_9CORY|nr:methyltransferase [Corynebacterium stercoris]MCP1387223.1 class I SAM-dependent methyltransferase [Corynebacterium stercoris]